MGAFLSVRTTGPGFVDLGSVSAATGSQASAAASGSAATSPQTGQPPTADGRSRPSRGPSIRTTGNQWQRRHRHSYRPALHPALTPLSGRTSP